MGRLPLRLCARAAHGNRGAAFLVGGCYRRISFPRSAHEVKISHSTWRFACVIPFSTGASAQHCAGPRGCNSFAPVEKGITHAKRQVLHTFFDLVRGPRERNPSIATPYQKRRAPIPVRCARTQTPGDPSHTFFDFEYGPRERNPSIATPYQNRCAPIPVRRARTQTQKQPSHTRVVLRLC